MNDLLTPLAIVGLVFFGIAVVVLPILVVSDLLRSFRQLRRGAATVRFQMRWGGKTTTAANPGDDAFEVSGLEELLERGDVGEILREDLPPRPSRRERDPSVPEGWGFD